MTEWTPKIGSYELLAEARKRYQLDLADDELRDLGSEVVNGAYSFGIADRFFADKADGSKRPLVNLKPRDKIVMRAILDVIQPEFARTFSDYCFSQSGRGTAMALATLHVDLIEWGT